MNYTLNTTAPGTGRLTTLEALKDYLKIDPSDTSQDAALDLVIDQVGSDFVSGLGRVPWVQTYEVAIAGQGGIFLELPVWPVIEVVSVTTSSGAEVTGWQLHDTGTASRRRDLWRAGCWTQGRISRAPASAGDQDLNYKVVFRAGWPMGDQVVAREDSTGYTLGQWAEVAGKPGFLMEVTTAGTSGTGEPTWPAVGETVTDGTVVWTTRRASKLPANLELAARIHGSQLHKRILEPPEFVSRVEDSGGGAVSLRFGARTMSRYVLNALADWR